MDFKLVRSTSGDWYGLYANNELQIEGHSLNPTDVLSVLQGLEAYPTKLSVYDAEPLAVEDFGGFRLNFEDNVLVVV